MDSRLTASQQIVHQKIGRNLLCFQYMERMLELLTAINGFEGSLSKFRDEFAARLKKIERLPMGKLVDTVARKAFVADKPLVGTYSNSKEVTFRFSFGLEGPAHLKKEWRRQQMEIVHERNTLVHRFIHDFDLRTIEGCEESALLLDQQRDRMISASQSIESMFRAMREALENIQLDET